MTKLINQINIVNGDSKDKGNYPPDGSVDLVVTSPPYKDCDGYSLTLIAETFSNVWASMRESALCFINFGHLAHQKSRPFSVVHFLETVFQTNLQETFIWVKNHYRPIQGSRRVNNLFEYVFMFCKGAPPTLNRLAVGLPYKDKSNAKRFAGGQDLKCAGNVLFIPYETINKKSQKLHENRFPVGLPRHFIKLANLKPNSLILDPFSGSGTTGVAALELGHWYYGIDINNTFCLEAKNRLNPLTLIEKVV